MDTVVFFIVSVFIYLHLMAYWRAGRTEECIRAFRDSIYDIDMRTSIYKRQHHELLARLEAHEAKIHGLEHNPAIAEDVLQALGGTVERCYDIEGHLKSITIKVPWMKEPAKYVNYIHCADVKFDEEPMIQRWCEDALRQLTSKLTEKKAKK